MPRLTKGEVMPDFVYNTVFQKGVKLSETVAESSKTALVFLRYHGCTLCRLDMHELAKNYDSITAGGAKLFVVLQSDPDKLAGEIKQSDLPFDIICDPAQTLYKRFEILPAKNKAQLADIATVAKVAKATAAGFKHGDYEGEELQLPAVFVLNPDLTLDHVHYGKSAGDVPGPKELAKLLAK